jgi:hypothetical protein
VFTPNEGSAGVQGLAAAFRAKGYQQIEITNKAQFQPGDFVFSSHHCGFIGEVANGQVWDYDNSSATGELTHGTIESRDSFNPAVHEGIYVMRAPEANAA